VLSAATSRGKSLLIEPRWVVVVTQANRERWAQENLARQGYESYFPKVVEIVRAKSSKECRIKPLFPRYGFVQVVDKWRSLLGTFGVTGVVGGETPWYMSQADLNKVRLLENIDGYVVLPKLREGQQVRVKGGLFTGQTGLHAGQRPNDRSKVLMAYLGRQVPVLIDNAYLEAA
jgi:transcriptional antiterminator RfaH